VAAAAVAVVARRIAAATGIAIAIAGSSRLQHHLLVL